MSKNLFPEYCCYQCSAYDNKRYNERSCNGGKKPRRFMNKDPKRKVPSWCPKQKQPPVVRVYRLKDKQSEYMHFMFEHKRLVNASKSTRTNIMSEHYAKAFEGKAAITAKRFYEVANGNETLDLIAFELEYGDVVEIDDGLNPYFFYFKSSRTVLPVYFKPPIDDAPAQTNKE